MTKNTILILLTACLLFSTERIVTPSVEISEEFINCSVSKPSGIKEINPVRDFLLNLKQKRKSNESTFKSRETYKRNTT